MAAWGAAATSPWTAETITTKWLAEPFRISRRIRSRSFRSQRRNSRRKRAARETSIINILTKSGTNEFHGSLFDYERNRHLDAEPGTLSSGLPKAPFDREQFGGSLGGPFKKNKAWWFGSVEYRNQNAAIETGERDFTTDTIVNAYAPSPLRDALVSSRVDYQIDPATR